MKQGTIQIDDLKKLITSIQKSFMMYGPVEDGGEVTVSELKNGQAPVLDYSILKKPIKGLFFPQSETILTSEGGGPFDEAGSDVLMFKDADTLFFQACSPAGTAFMAEFAGHFKKPKAGIVETRKKAAAKAVKKPLRLEGGRLFEKLDGSLEPAFWDSLAWRCLGCAACTYLCPTCHCFMFSDQRSAAGSKRSRNWDACSFELFTREASGHNPRSSKGQRMKQRIMHKFRYATENFGDVFCVGCGRCNVGAKYVCKDGPVFNFKQIEKFAETLI